MLSIFIVFYREDGIMNLFLQKGVCFMFLLLAGGLLIILLAVVIAVVSSVVSAVAAATDDEEDWHPDFGLSVFFFILPVIFCIYLMTA